MSDRYSNYTAGFNGSGLVLNQLGSASLSAGQSFNEFIASGALDRSAVILNSAKPMYRIGTRDLATVFGTISPTVGYNCTSSSVFRLQQRAAQGGFSGSTTNVTATAGLGFLYPDGISASGDSPAELQLMFAALSSTGVATDYPVVPANSVDFTSVLAPTHNSTFYLGPAYANSVLMAGLISASVDFGITFDLYMHDGNVYATEGSITARRPRFRLQFVKASMLFSLTPTIFNTALPGVFAQYFRKGIAGGARYPDASAVHCKVSCAAGSYAPADVQVADESSATITYEVIPTGAISLSVASAIP